VTTWQSALKKYRNGKNDIYEEQKHQRNKQIAGKHPQTLISILTSSHLPTTQIMFLKSTVVGKTKVIWESGVSRKMVTVNNHQSYALLINTKGTNNIIHKRQ
jgi:P pilus assembly chaperone PapD